MRIFRLILKRGLWVPAIFFLLVLIFFYPIFFGKVPIPFDLLAGAYFPWLDYKWGFTVGVPIKNPLLSDVISQLYPWRVLAMEIWKTGQWPLWNVFAFSGTPLLANGQSAALYPLNILLLVFGDIKGWTLMVILQPLLSLVFLYMFLRELGLSRLASLSGALVFAFSSFMMVWLEYGTLTQAGLWLPLMILLIEKFAKKSFLAIFFLPIIIFFSVTAGSFQVTLYALLLAYLYLLFRVKKFSLILIGTGFFGLGLMLSSIQLLPSAELFLTSIRQADAYVAKENFGLLPFQNIITFLAPDFFGNPTTANFWGVNNYQETAGYFSIVALPFLLLALFKKRDFFTVFFGLTFIVSVLLIFDTFLGRLVYYFNVPILSTSYASRMVYIVDFSAAILAAKGLEIFAQDKKLVVRLSSLLLVILIAVGIFIIYLMNFGDSLALWRQNTANLMVSAKNLVLPIILVCSLVAVIRLFKNINIAILGILLLMAVDLMRFGLKYNPFVNPSLSYPQTPVLDYLKQDTGHFRIERERTEVMPPNTWMSYKLMSPSGYDPLYSREYASFYNVYDATSSASVFSRYAELENYNSPILDLAGVKYLTVAKRDQNNKIDQTVSTISKNIVDPKFRRVFEDQTVVVLENTAVLPRVLLFDQVDIENNYLDALDKLSQDYNFRERVILNQKLQSVGLRKGVDDYVGILEYRPNEVTVQAKTGGDAVLVLTDTYFPGWKAYLNQQPAKILVADGVFRAVELPAGESIVKFKYQPESFSWGLVISGASLFILLTLLLFFKLKRWPL